MAKDLEQMTNNAESDIQPTRQGNIFVKGVYDTAKQYISTQVQLAVEGIKDIAVQAKNATQRAQLTEEYIEALDQKICADLKRFEAAALKQYGEGFSGQTPIEADERVMHRIGTRYNGPLRGLKGLLLDSETKPDLPETTSKKLAGLIAGYEISNSTSRMKY